MIRPYTFKDFAGIKEVIDSVIKGECWPHYYPDGWNEERIKQEFNPIYNYNDSIFLVSNNEKITGLIAGHDLDSFIDNEIPHLKEKFKNLELYNDKVFYQRDIIIHNTYQRGILGLELFKLMQRHALRRNYTGLVTRTPLLNIRGRKFFEKIGYIEIFEDNNPERVYFYMKNE